MSLNLPPSWPRMGWTQKAAYLCAAKHARDYSHACSILASMRKPKAKLPPQRQQKLWYREE